MGKSKIQLKKKHTAYVSLVSGRSLIRKEEDKFILELEMLMNEYDVFKLEAVLNPYNTEVYIK